MTATTTSPKMMDITITEIIEVFTTPIPPPHVVSKMPMVLPRDFDLQQREHHRIQKKNLGKKELKSPSKIAK